MKKFLFSFLFLGLFSLCCFAQNKSLRFIYITKDYSTAVTPLCNKLNEIYDLAAKDNTNAVIFYLANSTDPSVVKMNLQGDNRKDMDNLLGSLITKSQTIVNPSVDIHSILSIFDGVGLLDKNGEHSFTSVELVFYVTPTFWALQYNEQLIASLYFDLDLDEEWAENYVGMSVYHNEDDGLKVDEKHPFGKKNICGKYKFKLLTY